MAGARTTTLTITPAITLALTSPTDRFRRMPNLRGGARPHTADRHSTDDRHLGSVHGHCRDATKAPPAAAGGAFAGTVGQRLVPPTG